MLTQTELAQQEKYNQDVTPVILPVLPGTWLDAKKMGLDLDAGNFEFVEEGTHVWESVFLHYGWFKTVIQGYYPYTDTRDFYAHDRQGIGRPWIRALPDQWRDLIFRELILLILSWNSLVDSEYRIKFERDETYPRWLERWLSLTNSSWRQGAQDLGEEVYRYSSIDVDESTVYKIVRQYNFSGNTWRPLMPEKAVHHQKYAERGEHWTFERL